MIEVAEVQPERCMYEPCLNIMPDWGRMQSTFGHTTLYEIIARHILIL
jgi:hypothetical protein